MSHGGAGGKRAIATESLREALLVALHCITCNWGVVVIKICQHDFEKSIYSIMLAFRQDGGRSVLAAWLGRHVRAGPWRSSQGWRRTGPCAQLLCEVVAQR